MKRLLIAEQWDSFEREVLPKDAPAFQRQEIRSAFYSGAVGLLAALTATDAGDGLKVALSIKAELRAYMNSLKKSASAIR